MRQVQNLSSLDMRNLLGALEAVDDVQASLPAKDRARVEREGNLLWRAEYEKYLNDVASPEA